MNSRTRFLIGLATVVLSASQVSGNQPDHEKPAEAAIHELSEPDLKAFYARCSSLAVQQALGGPEIALCSVGYELLLNRSFQGDFYAFLAWSRSQPDDVSEIAPTSDKPIKRR